MMLGSARRAKSTNGTEIRGSAAGVWTRYSRSDVTISSNGRSQHAQVDPMTAVTRVPVRRPCTKGAAIASMPQAAKNRSPLSRRTRCGVVAAVTG